MSIKKYAMLAVVGVITLATLARLYSTQLIDGLDGRPPKIINGGVQTKNQSSNSITTSFPQLIHPQCESYKWIKRYAEFHHNELKKPLREQRLFVVENRWHGFTDRLNAIVTGFYAAVLSDRAFKIQWGADEFGLEGAFTYNFINWSAAPTDLDPKYGGILKKDLLVHGFVGYQDAEINQLFGDEELAESLSRNRTVYFTANQGQIWTLFENPKIKRKLFQLGMRPETAVGCAFRFLFRARPEVIEKRAEEWLAVTGLSKREEIDDRLLAGITPLPANRTVWIGMQLRYGDDAFKRKSDCHKIRPKFFESFQNCADKLRKSLNVPARFLFISDCATARKMAIEKMGATVSLDTDNVQHLQSGGLDEFRVTASELLLLAFTDYQIISTDSGFGRYGASISLQFHNQYSTINMEHCGRYDFDSWQQSAFHWTRLRR